MNLNANRINAEECSIEERAGNAIDRPADFMLQCRGSDTLPRCRFSTKAIQKSPPHALTLHKFSRNPSFAVDPV